MADVWHLLKSVLLLTMKLNKITLHYTKQVTIITGTITVITVILAFQEALAAYIEREQKLEQLSSSKKGSKAYIHIKVCQL